MSPDRIAIMLITEGRKELLVFALPRFELKGDIGNGVKTVPIPSRLILPYLQPLLNLHP
jgi:hypothetical protein